MLAKLVEQYLHYRSTNNLPKLIALLSDNIVIESERDGVHSGKKEASKYYQEIKASGKWEQPVQTAYNEVEVKGSVYVLFLTFGVKATFTFDDDNLIEKIVIKRV